MASIYHDQAMELVKAQAQVRPMTADEMFKLRDEIIAKMEGQSEVVQVEEETCLKPIMDPKKAIGERNVTCLICGAKMKVLTAKHLAKHGISPEAYREQFGYKKGQPLACKSLSRARKDKMKDMKLWERRIKKPVEIPAEKASKKAKAEATPATAS